MPEKNEHLQDLLTQIYIPVQAYYQKQQQNVTWNIFDALGKNKYADELIHSYFLATLLQLKIDGKRVFLQLFLDMLGKKFHFTDIQSAFNQKCIIQTEYNIGPLSADYLSGGRIDLILFGTETTIILENKIFADDQTNQLFRYYHAFPQAKIIYLTRFGTHPTATSVYKMEEEGGKYYCLSYEQDILSWLQECRHALAHAKKPISSLQTALVQYQAVIEKITNQGEKREMNKEIINIATANEANFITALHIGQNYIEIYKKFIQDKLITPLQQFIGNDFQLEIESSKMASDSSYEVVRGFSVYHPSWKHIRLYFRSESYNGWSGLYGICQKVTSSTPRVPKALSDYFKQKYVSYDRTAWWPLVGELDYLLDREETVLQLCKPEGQAQILAYFKQRITELLKIADQAQKDGVEL